MTCRDVDQFLMAYLSGELPALTHAQFVTHLAICSTCRRYIKQYQQSISVGKAAFAEPTDVLSPVPDDLVHAILDATRHVER